MPLSRTGWEGERKSDDAQVRRPARVISAIHGNAPGENCGGGKDGSEGLPDI